MDKHLKEYTESGKKNLIVVYILYLCGVVAPPLPLIGVVFAYINKDKADNFAASHYVFLFRTFCFAAIGWVICFTDIWIVLDFALAIWYILRIVIGFKYMIEDQAYPNPMTYWIK
ncbi:putative membrane protein [Rickettsia felis str. Pedreira]|nr:DUF4870 family protein [Rickettsia felis]KHO02366.1 NADH dehydrogenase [Rickettsia felis str. LSU]KHO02663.1 NADH dehydrogenase [Rickettsia felis]KJV58718.1 putative membrane protein [Rickettsia felis str. Pedreira]MDE8610691.1 DUF4870 family protein [Rickettsia felis]